MSSQLIKFKLMRQNGYFTYIVFHFASLITQISHYLLKECNYICWMPKDPSLSQASGLKCKNVVM